MRLQRLLLVHIDIKEKGLALALYFGKVHLGTVIINAENIFRNL